MKISITMTEKADAEAMDLLVQMVTDEHNGNVGKSDSFDLDLDMSEFVVESRVESIIINNARNDTEKPTAEERKDTVCTEQEAGTSSEIEANISNDLRPATPTALESKSVQMSAVEQGNALDAPEKLPVMETASLIDEQSKVNHTPDRDKENNPINVDAKSSTAAKIVKRHKCLACYYCPNSLNPKLRQFTRLEQKIINHIAEHRDLILNQPIIILERCDSLVKNTSIETKRHSSVEKPAIVKENGLEEKKKYMDKELKAKMQKMAAEKAKAKELDAQKSLYNKILKKQSSSQHGKSSCAEKTANVHNVSKPDSSIKTSSLNQSSSVQSDVKAKVEYQKSKFHLASKQSLPQQTPKAVNKVDPLPKPLMSITFGSANSATNNPAEGDASKENDGTKDATSDDKNKDLNSFKIKKIDKKILHRKTTNYISPLDQILYETNRFQTTAAPTNKSTPMNNARKRTLNDKVVGGSFADSQLKKPKMPEDVVDNGRTTKTLEKPSENLTRSFEFQSTTRFPSLNRSPPPCAADFDSSPSPSYSSANADYAAVPFRANNSSSRLAAMEAAMSSSSKAPASDNPTFPDRATMNIPGIYGSSYGSSPYENGSQARRSSVDMIVGDARSQAEIPLVDGRPEQRKSLLDRDFKEIVQDTSLLSLFQQAGPYAPEETDRTHVEEVKMPKTIESFLDDIVRKRKSGILGDEFMAKEMAPRQPLLGAPYLEFPNAINDRLDFRRQSQDDLLLRGPKTPPSVTMSSSSSASGRPVLLPNTDPYSLAASKTANPNPIGPVSSLSSVALQNDSVVNIAAMKKYPTLEDFIKPAIPDNDNGNASRRTTLLPEVFPSTSSSAASYPSSTYPLLDRQFSKSSNNNDLDVRQLLSGQTSSSASLRMSDAESYFMSNVSTKDLSSILKQLEKEEHKIRQNKLAKETDTPREIDIANFFGQGMAQTINDTCDDDDDVEILVPNPSSMGMRPVNEMHPSASPSTNFLHPPASSSSSILAQNSAVDKWADEMLEKLQRNQSIGCESDSLDEILKRITASNRNKDTPSVAVNFSNAIDSSRRFGENSSASIDDDSSVHKTLSALRLLLDAGGDQRPAKKMDNFRKETTPPPSNSALHTDSNRQRPHHDLLFDRYRLSNEINEILASRDEFLINHFVRTLQQELISLRPPEPRVAPDELLQITAVFDTMLCEPTSILNRDVRRRREVERILPLMRAVGNLGSENLQNAVMTPVMPFLQDLIEKSLA